jgi:predicted transcriptional regulator
MAAPRTISFRIDSEKVAELDRIAKSMDRDRSYLLNEAVEIYLSEQKRFAAMIEEGLQASRRGELIDDDAVGAMIDAWSLKSGPPESAIQIATGQGSLKVTA